MEKQNDVYLVEHKPYYVTFDWYTPKPYLIILPMEEDSKYHFLKSMRPSEKEMNDIEKQALVETAKKIYESLPKQSNSLPHIPNVDSPAVFAVNFWAWYGQASLRFHTHICIAVSVYENLLSKYKADPVLKQQLRGTRKTKSYDSYLELAKRPPKDYTVDDMKALHMSLGEQCLVDDWTKFAFHEKYMRIEFISRSNDTLSLLKEIDDFIMKHGLHRKGGQICIDLSCKGFSGFMRLSDGVTIGKSSVQGYLQLPGDVFGMFLNGSKQTNIWIKNDHASIGIVYT